MPNYSIVASDLDGTLFNNSSSISFENIKAINALRKLGVHFVPSTGRSFSEIPTQLRENDCVRFFICSNGAVVVDKFEGPRILNCISNSVGREVLDLLTAFETEINFRHNGYLIADSELKNQQYYNHLNVVDAHVDCIIKHSKRVDDFTKYAYNADNIEVFTVFFHNYADKMYCKKQLEQNTNLGVVEGFEYNLEIMNINAGKGNALCALAKELSINQTETISIGDSGNDISIIKAAGLGLAVSNATESLKAAADNIICSNEEHVVEYVLNNYF